MLKNLKIASRFLLKHQEYSLINIGGLAFSLVCVFLITLYLYDELTFDRFHEGSDRVFRVIENSTSDTGEESALADVAFRLSTVQDEIPAVEHTLKITSFGRSNVSNDENTNVFHADMPFGEQTFFEIFDYPLLRGDRTTALKNAYSVVLTASMARRIFGTIEVVGKSIRTGRSDQPYQVTGVLKDFPSNSHLDFGMLFSLESHASADWYKKYQAGDWSSNYFSTYYKLKPMSDASEVSNQLTALVNGNRPEGTMSSRFWLQPLADIHFYSSSIRAGFNSRPGEIYYIYIFAAVGLFILMIACVNYINLSTAFSITRGKEVGVKKVAGALRSQLVKQFLTESTIITLASVTLALFLVNILLAAFNDFTGKNIEVEMLFRLPSLAIITGFALILGVLSGTYPALFLSKLKPVHAIRAFSKSNSNSSWLRKSLVVFQFTLSISLIIASITAYRQIQYIRNKHLGFNQEQLVVLDINSGTVRRDFEQIKTELSRIPAAMRVAVTSRVPGEWKNLAQVNVTTTNHPLGSSFFFFGADEDFLATFEVPLFKGRNFVAGKSDSTSILINETAARILGVSEPGDQATIPSLNTGVSDELLDRPFDATIIGIVKDFHFQSLHQKIEPLVIGFRINPIQSIDYFTVRLIPGNWDATRDAMQKVIHQADPDHPLEYNFLDERLEDFYREDVRRGKLFGIAAAISIALACLGLFSLVSFSTELRTKEIGIRKTLGATVSQITFLLSRDYVKLVTFGFLIAVPFSIWALQSWLSSFAYRIEVNGLILVLAGILSILVTFATVGFKSIKAARANPVKALRSE